MTRKTKFCYRNVSIGIFPPPQSLLYCEIGVILVTLALNSHLRGFRGKTANTHEISQQAQTVHCIL